MEKVNECNFVVNNENNKMGLINRIAATTIVVILAFGSVLYTSCKKETVTPATDKCSTVVCQNNGSCISGVCYCAAGYEGDYCEKASVARYIGTWVLQETVAGSSIFANIGKTKTYEMKIRKGSMALDILADNFMGGGYNDVAGIIGRKYGAAQVETDVYTKFILSANQTMKGSYITLIRGSGTINDIGTEMSGSYITKYLDNGKIVDDSVTFLASFKQ